MPPAVPCVRRSVGLAAVSAVLVALLGAAPGQAAERVEQEATAVVTPGQVVLGPATFLQRPPPATPEPGAEVVGVSTAAELDDALRAARPGTTIELADGRYEGRFVVEGAGSPQRPITLRGSRAAVLDGGDPRKGYALHVTDAEHWVLQGFTVTGAQKGVMVDRSSRVRLDGLDVGNTGMEAVHLRNGSSDNVVTGLDVHDTGLVRPGFGEGVYIGSAVRSWEGDRPDRSDRNQVLGNRIVRTTAEAIDVKEGTTGGRLQGNVLDGALMRGDNYADSLIDVKGNGYVVADNTGTRALLDGFQTHVVAPGWGEGTTFVGNVVQVAGRGYGVRVHKPDSSRTVVGCDNVFHGPRLLGPSNQPCH